MIEIYSGKPGEAARLVTKPYCRTKLTSSQVVAYIEGHPNCTVNDIADSYSVTYATVMQKLKPLIESGEVQRQKREGEKYSPFGHFLAAPASEGVEGQLVPQLDGLPVLSDDLTHQVIEERSRDAIALSVDALLSRIGAYAEEVATHAAVEFKQRFFERLNSEIAGLELPAPDALLAAKIRKLRICVVGSQSINASALQEAFKNELTLDCISADEIRKIQKSTRNAYATILMVDHVSHKAKQAIEASGVKPVFVNGGLSSLKDKLEEIYAVS